MNIPKTLYDISWQVSEKEYRKDLALSYSTLSRYEREGFDNLEHLFDKIETPSLTLGGLVDTIITGSKEEFDNLYYVSTSGSIGEKEQQIVKMLFNAFKEVYASFSTIPYNDVLDVVNSVEFQKNWRDDTRVRVIRERCSYYYNLLSKAEGKTIIDINTYNTACAMVQALRNSFATKHYFADNKPDSPIQRYYQLKFKNTFEGIAYRIMADLIVVDYENKKVIPVDLKTSSHTEWNFKDSFLTYNYMIQSRLYWRNIRAAMDKDDYFKDFTLENYKFIVVNKKTLTPLVWEFPYTQYVGTLKDDNGKKYRDPFVIGEELQYYLDEHPRVPRGISIDKPNILICLHPEE